jgi:hypothetical protein
MDWKELQENTKALTGIAAQKLNEASDYAALLLKLKTAEYRKKSLYEEFGQTAYRYFTTEEESAEGLKKYIKAISAAEREVLSLKKQLEDRRAEAERKKNRD